jgi:hypothetical protein
VKIVFYATDDDGNDLSERMQIPLGLTREVLASAETADRAQIRQKYPNATDQQVDVLMKPLGRQRILSEMCDAAGVTVGRWLRTMAAARFPSP